MKKRIAIQDLRPGMYIAGMDQSWFQTPFLRHKWLVKREDEITLLRSYGIQNVFIDTEKGCDVIEAPHIQETSNSQDVSSDDTLSPPGLDLAQTPKTSNLLEYSVRKPSRHWTYFSVKWKPPPTASYRSSRRGEHIVRWALGTSSSHGVIDSNAPL